MVKDSIESTCKPGQARRRRKYLPSICSHLAWGYRERAETDTQKQTPPVLQSSDHHDEGVHHFSALSLYVPPGRVRSTAHFGKPSTMISLDQRPRTSGSAQLRVPFDSTLFLCPCSSSFGPVNLRGGGPLGGGGGEEECDGRVPDLRVVHCTKCTYLSSCCLGVVVLHDASRYYLDFCTEGVSTE